MLSILSRFNSTSTNCIQNPPVVSLTARISFTILFIYGICGCRITHLLSVKSYKETKAAKNKGVRPTRYGTRYGRRQNKMSIIEDFEKCRNNRNQNHLRLEEVFQSNDYSTSIVFSSLISIIHSGCGCSSSSSYRTISTF
jgi:hypothetical protein